jgi:hypothetical protein
MNPENYFKHLKSKTTPPFSELLTQKNWHTKKPLLKII